MRKPCQNHVRIVHKPSVRELCENFMGTVREPCENRTSSVCPAFREPAIRDTRVYEPQIRAPLGTTAH